MPLSNDADFRNRTQLSTATTYGINVCQAAGGLAAIWVLDMSPLAAQGARQHGTPRHYNCPGVLLDRNAGQKVLADAAAGKTATVVLNATVKDTRPAQLIAYLPGKNYGKAERPEAADGDPHRRAEQRRGQRLARHHGRAASTTRRSRRRSVRARSWCTSTTATSSRARKPAYPFDYMEDFPDAAHGLVGGLAMEHFGGVQFHEIGDDYKGDRLARAHQRLHVPQSARHRDRDRGRQGGEAAACQRRRAARGRPGQRLQQARRERTEPGLLVRPQLHDAVRRARPSAGFHVTGDWPSAGYQAYYPSVGVRVDSEYFRTNVRTSIRLLQTLSTEDLTKYAPDWGIVRANIDSLTAANFQAGVDATTAKAEFLTQFDAIFALVRKGDYAGASLQLPALADEAADAGACRSGDQPVGEHRPGDRAGGEGRQPAPVSAVHANQGLPRRGSPRFFKGHHGRVHGTLSHQISCGSTGRRCPRVARALLRWPDEQGRDHGCRGLRPPPHGGTATLGFMTLRSSQDMRLVGVKTAAAKAVSSSS